MIGMGECYEERDNPLAFLIPGVGIDNNGNLYTSFYTSFGGWGYQIKLQKRDYANKVTTTGNFYLWREIISDCVFGYESYPRLISLDSSYLDEFKAHVHNIFQHSFIQEIEGVNSDYIYLLSYLPPARYLWALRYGDLLNKPEGEGLFILKIDKSNLEIVDKKLYNASDYPSLSYDRTPRITNSWDYEHFNQKEGNYHGFIDGDDIYVFYLAHDSNDSNLLRTYYLKINANNLEVSENDLHNICNHEAFQSGGTQLVPRFQKLGDTVYFCLIVNGYYYRLGDGKENALHKQVNPAKYLITTQQDSCRTTTFHTDFCMVDNGAPIWCMLCFNSNASGSCCNAYPLSSFWSSTYMNWMPGRVCLCVHSYNADSNDNTTSAYPSDTLYITSRYQGNPNPNQFSAMYIRSVSDNTNDPLGCLYLNTHKIIPYTSPSGKKYFIFAYCYPGKKTHAYLGYCTYSIDSSNFIHLNTKVILKSPNSGDDWGDSFSPLTSCSRIISLDVKNDHLWMTWMNDENSGYYCFHIKASDLIQE